MKYLGSFMLLLICITPLSAAELNITTLLEAAGKRPDMQSSQLAVETTAIQLEQARAELYPKLSAFGNYERYNSPTNLRPMPPTEVNVAAGDSLPFSKEIKRYGLKVEMPLFVKGLYTLANKVKQLQQGSKIGHELKLLTRQAEVVSIDASLAYVTDLNAAIAARLESLQKTRDDLQMAVDNGRVPESELLRLDTTINTLQKQQNDLQIQKLTLVNQLKQLTGLEIENFVSLTQQRPVVDGEFLRQKQQQANVAVAEQEVQRTEDQYYPTVKLVGAMTENYGTAYNTDDSINRSYNYLGINISLPLFDRTLSTATDFARMQLHREQQQLAQVRIDVATEADTLHRQLPLLERSQSLALKSFDNSRKVLEIARVAYRNGRITTEEYLRNETEVLDAEAALHQTNRDRWQVICRQAVLFGDDLTGVVQ
ncbi:MAG: TolC family protein [Pseudomonadota bacterium]